MSAPRWEPKSHGEPPPPHVMEAMNELLGALAAVHARDYKMAGAVLNTIDGTTCFQAAMVLVDMLVQMLAAERREPPVETARRLSLMLYVERKREA